MKKIISMMLALAVMLGIGAPAFAASADKELEQVTAKVKSALNIGNEYTEFYGETANNGIFSYWNLNWNSDKKSLMVEANPNGKVMSYYLNYEDTESDSNIPSFPKTRRDEARKTAESFVKKVITSGESVTWDSESSTRANTSQHMFSGDILFNGLPAPVTFSITVNAERNEIIRFRRSDRGDGFVGGIPDAKPSADKAAAANLLKGSLKLKIEYVTDEGNEKQAVLRYIPADDDSYYVDAKTGKLVNLTEVYEDLARKGSYLFDEKEGPSGDAAAMSGGGGSAYNDAGEAPQLSETEKDGIAKMEGVMSKDEIDKKLKGISALGLAKQGLTSFNYWLDRENNEVYASLHYALKDDASKRNTSITANARTGEIQSLYSWLPYEEGRAAEITEEQAQKNAEDFLKSMWPDEFAQLELYGKEEPDLASGTYSFNFVRKVNGYFFPANNYSVSINVTDGTIMRLGWEYDSEISFQDASDIITEENALDSWFQSYETELGYWRVPVALDPNNPQYKYLIAEGQNYYYGLALAYYLGREDEYTGVDAKTGSLVSSSSRDSQTITYSDIDSTWAKAQMEELAEYGIGYPGGKLLPADELKQIDFISLLVSTRGYYYDTSRKDAADDLYRFAYNMGILTSDERNDNAVLTRMDVVKLILDYMGYKEVAGLQNIFRCTFTDESEIPADSYGYAAIAQGMGIVGGDGKGAFAPNRTATRVEAAVMVYNYMNR